MKLISANIPNELKLKMEETLQKRVESLVFYGTDDEAYELFCHTCGLLYLMNGLGQEAKAEILYDWAKEFAKESKEFALEEYGSLDESDQANGIYGINQ